MVENFDEFDKWLAICQTFSYQSSSVIASLKPTRNCQSFAHQSFVNGSFVKCQIFAIWYWDWIKNMTSDFSHLKIHKIW